MNIYENIPRQNRCRWFLQHGACTRFDRGFRNKDEIEVWIRTLRLDWRSGYTFRIRGEEVDSYIVNRRGFLARV